MLGGLIIRPATSIVRMPLCNHEPSSKERTALKRDTTTAVVV